MTAGMTFLGQFLDHDMTLDITSSLEQQVDPEMIQNFRVPTFGLDSVYGPGPAGSPYLYDQTVDDGRTTLLIEPNPESEANTRDGSQKFDLPRNSQGTPLVGDPRNDENRVLSQLQVAFISFHNALVAHVKSATSSPRGASSTNGAMRHSFRSSFRGPLTVSGIRKCARASMSTLALTTPTNASPCSSTTTWR